jgi:hypothetical protein
MKKMSGIFKRLNMLIIPLLLFSSLLTPTYAEESNKGPVKPETINVDTTVSAPMASSACGNGTVYFRITGTYKLLLDQASSPNMSVTMKSYVPSDWKVTYQYSTFAPSGSNIRVTIYYYFTTTYFDCPVGGGPQYASHTVYIN